jgi:DNA-binding XRE family transcriptional regulator
MIAHQQYRSVDEVRAAFRGAKAKMLRPANAAAIEYRLRLGLSQAKMAALFGLSRSTLQRIEAGSRSVPPAMRAAMKGAM